jgi:hypothetical protein
LGGRGRRISEFEASLVYRVSSRTAGEIQRNAVSKKKKKKKTKNKNKKEKRKRKKILAIDKDGLYFYTRALGWMSVTPYAEITLSTRSRNNDLFILTCFLFSLAFCPESVRRQSVGQQAVSGY